MHLLILHFADVTSDPISGGAGWVGAGLLGAVLAWLLLKHLPDKDRQLHDLLASKDEQMKTLLTSKDQQLAEQMRQERESCEHRHQENLTEIRIERDLRERQHKEEMEEFATLHSEAKEHRHYVGSLNQSVTMLAAIVRHVTGIRVDRDGNILSAPPAAEPPTARTSP